ncbi:MAG: fluoride efflux transporter FluC [Bacteroidota bacterium]|jgi:CrcB protein
MSWLFVFVGGGLGSLARFGIGFLFKAWFKVTFPFGTLISNFLACLIIGLILMLVQRGTRAEWIDQLIVIGFCGGLSTFSTFSNENLQLIQSGNYWIAIANLVISVGSGIAIIYILSTIKA